MPPLRRVSGRRAYEKSVAAVLGSRTGRRSGDPLAVRWAHQIAWAEHPHGRERDALAATAEHYGIDLTAVLAERDQPLPPVIPARRRQSPQPD